MTGLDPARLGPLPLREIDEAILQLTVDVKLTIEEVVLLVLHADARPVEGIERLTGEILLALKGPLGGPDVEPAVFKKGPGGLRSADVEYAVDSLSFSKGVRVSDNSGSSSGGKPGALRFEIAPRGKARIKAKWDALPAGTRNTLAQKRAEWDAAAPAAMKDPVYIHNEALLQAVLPDARGVRRAAETAPAAGGAGPAALPPPPSGRQVHMDRGDRLYGAGRYDEAYAAYKTAAGLGAPDADLELKMTASLAALRLYRPALRHCRAAIKADPLRADGYTAMGHCLYNLGLHARALPYSRRAAQRGPSDARPHMLRGAILDSLGRHSEALPHHLKAIRLDPGSVEARRNASLSLLETGRYKRALRHAKRAAKMSPNDPASHRIASTCLSQMGRYEEAARPARRAIKAAPARVDSYLPLLTSLLGLGRHEEAVEWCARAAEADPRDPRPRFAMALSLRALGRLEEALPHCLRAVELDPGNADFHTAMSQMLRGLGRLPEALSHCKAAVSAGPGSLPALSNMGGILADMGRHKEALACLGRAIRIDPRHPAPRYNRALALQQSGRPRRALAEYKRVVNLDPRNAGARNNMGTVLAMLGRHGKALAQLDRALELDPGSADAHHNKALSLRHLGRRKEALAHFDRALELDPGSADAYVGRISCLADLGLPDRKIGRYAARALGPAAPASAPPPPPPAPTEKAAPAPLPPGKAAPADTAAVRPAAAAGAASGSAARRRAFAPWTAGEGGGRGRSGGKGRAGYVDALLSKAESLTLEFEPWADSDRKGSLGQGKMAKKTARALCGLANAEGGDLLIGVGDGGAVEGLAPGAGRLSHGQKDKRLAWLAGVIGDYLGAGCGARFDCDIVEAKGLDILHCAVDPSADGPVTLKRGLEGGRYGFFVRVGDTCRPYGPKEMLGYVSKRWPGWAPRLRLAGSAEAEQKSGMAGAAERQRTGFPAGGAARWMGDGGQLL